MMIVEPLGRTTFMPVDIQSLDLSSIWWLKTWPRHDFKRLVYFNEVDPHRIFSMNVLKLTEGSALAHVQ